MCYEVYYIIIYYEVIIRVSNFLCGFSEFDESLTGFNEAIIGIT